MWVGSMLANIYLWCRGEDNAFDLQTENITGGNSGSAL